MRLAVYTDYPYHRVDGGIYAERAFALFLDRLGARFDRFKVIGRLAPGSERGRYPLGDHAELVPLPYYPSLGDPLPALRGMAGAVRRFWRALDDIDCIWLLGPHPLVFPFALLAGLRRRRVVLGVRQDFPAYVGNRHPQRRLIRAAAWALELGFRALGRVCPVIAVGPAIARHYGGARSLLEISVSLVDEKDVMAPGSRAAPAPNERQVLSVGRLDTEKNPLLLAEILALLAQDDPSWKMVICGEGSLEAELRARLEELGVADRAELRGYVALHEGLLDLYRRSDMLLHVSWTEGLPQVLFEAFAAALPVVATDVGGIAAASGDAVTLIPPGSGEAARDALTELAADPELRRRRVAAGHDLVGRMTIQAECDRVAAFIRGAPPSLSE